MSLLAKNTIATLKKFHQLDQLEILLQRWMAAAQLLDTFTMLHFVFSK